MALTYTGTNGLFTRLGALIYMMDAVRTHQTNLKTLVDNVEGEYSAADQYMVANISSNIESRILGSEAVLYDIRIAAEKTIVEMCWAEASASSSNSMREKTLDEALRWLIRDMDATSNSVEGTTITTGVLGSGAGNTGNGTFDYFNDAPNILLGSTNDWPNIRADLITARCIQDAQDSAVTPGCEVFRVTGTAAYASLDYRFPAGSGVDMTMASTTAEIDAGARGQNILTNSDLENWTANVPDNFTTVSGTAGTEFQSHTSTYYRGATCLKAPVTGSTWNIRQRIGVVSGTVGTMIPDRPYIICAAMKKDATATGTIRISLKDSLGNTLDSGSWRLEQSVASLTTSWALYTFKRRAPKALPSELYLHIEASGAITNAAAYIDEVILAEMIPIAPGGPALSIIAGSTNWVADDNVRRKWTNNNEGAFVRGFDRLFDMYGLGLSLPANYLGSETIADSLIA
jgi:hypothetical protein